MYNPDEEYQHMLDKFKIICKQKNKTQYALAKATGISDSSIWNIMNGVSKPYIYTMLLLCEALEISMGELFANFGLSSEEESIISAYRSLSPKKRRMLEVYVDMLLKYDEEF
ncbi:MAG: helix-turn-helix transcriptional regulator [Eubacteriales bacterium]|nr:helix-turn-helix transcriptional regulator [Eubacteriales bacterium]